MDEPMPSAIQHIKKIAKETGIVELYATALG
jgi:hypothetical protein